jgi:hypothetical protein
MSAVLLCTRFPTPRSRGAGATDRRGNLSNRKSFLMVLAIALLLAFAAWQEGVATMLSAVAIEFAVYFAVTVGSRVQSRT